MGISESEERLREYIEKDIIYQDYKNSNKEPSDFERFCFVHCRDIENVLDKLKELKEQIKEKIVFVGRMQNKTRDYIHNLEKENRELQQENQQLKEEYDGAFQDAEELNQRLTEVIDERNNLLSVLDEIREYIEKDYSFAKRGDIPLLTKDEQLAGKLFEILDKVNNND